MKGVPTGNACPKSGCAHSPVRVNGSPGAAG